MQKYFRRAKAACLCSYCCNLHVWFYDRVRLGRLEIATLRVDARAKEGKGEGEGKDYLSSAPSRAAQDSPYFLLSFGVSTRRFGEKKHSRARRKREKENTTWGRAWQSNGRKKSFAVEIGLQGVFTHVTSRIQICCNKRKRLHHKKRVHLPQDTNMATVLMLPTSVTWRTWRHLA